VQNCKTCSANHQKANDVVADGLCHRCAVMITAINRYNASNIPVAYWNLGMSDFKGPKELKQAYDVIVEKLNEFYTTGKSVCFAGPHGCGKTTIVSNILKIAVQKNFSAQYTTMSDMVSVLIDAQYEDKYQARKDLMSVDFLVIDEFDGRFFTNGNGADLFGRTLECVVRTRLQNQLPTIFCSNSPNPIEAFNGQLKASIDSLMSNVKIISVFGSDYRKVIGQ
jgi:DNA replication protein DnaC